MNQKILIIAFLLKSFFSVAAEFYVAPNGNDANTGTISSPLETIKRAQQLASSGDTVYIRGGLYLMREDQIAQYNSIWAYVTKLDKSGINYLAYANETPVFDYKNIKPANYRIIAFYINGSNIRIKGIEVIGVQVTITTHTQSECFEIQGSNNTLEQLSMHDNMAIGVYIVRGSNNLILNCDAYRNWDSVSEGGAGGNTDGFGAHAPAGHVNNVFRGCRAWFNSDDGFDLISSAEPVLIDNCWAFYNGYSSGFVSRADGNGFKAGGYGSTTPDKLPNPIPRNIIQFCLAVGNKQSGFYSNHHLNGSDWYNNSAYRNKRNYNMLNRKAVNSDDYLTDVPGWGHVMKNNLGYKATLSELTDIDKAACTLSNNYFDLSLTINDADFISLDETLLTAPREADGSLPKNNFFKLTPTSDIIDKGTDIDFAFRGIAPDLGCFESNYDQDNDGVTDLYDICPNTPAGQLVDGRGCILLAADNFSIETIGETCANKKNGQIKITAKASYNYVATINTIAYNFTDNNLNVSDLPSGSYDICINVAGTTAEQCYSVEIKAGTTITAKSSKNAGETNFEIIEGTAPYNVIVNGKLSFTTADKTFDVTSKPGDVIEVKTAVACEGIFSKTINSADQFIAFPNPTKGLFEIAVPSLIENMTVELYTIEMQLISRKLYPVEYGKVQLSLENQAQGVYFVKLAVANNPVTLKIIKK